MIVSKKINVTGNVSTLAKVHQDTKIINVGKSTKDSGVAAIFRKSTLGDYNEKELSPLQKSMMSLQEQIGKIQENENIDSGTKKELLENLNNQLEELKGQLEQDSSTLTSKTNSDSDSDSNSLSTPKDSNGIKQPSQEDIISMGSDLERVKTVRSTSVKIENEAKLEQKELDRAVNNPRENLQLKDSDIIARRQGDIDRKNASVENLNSIVQDGEKDSKEEVDNAKIDSVSDSGDVKDNDKKDSSKVSNFREDESIK